MKKQLIISGLLILAGCASLFAASLAWDSSTNYTDGTICPVQGYRLYWGPTSGSYTMTQNVGMVLTTTIPAVSNRTYFAVTVYDTSGNESIFSTELIYNGWTSLPPVLSSLSYTYKTGKMSMSWSAPTVNTDGSLISTTGATLAGYTIGYGRSTGVYTSFTNLSANLTTASITVSNNSGPWYFAINASNVYGLVSAYSQERSSGTSLPNKPGNFRMVP